MSVYSRLPLFVLLLSLIACATNPLSQDQQRLNRLSHELHQVPFFPQQSFQCGPAAVATVLAYEGVEIDPEQLVAEVYLPRAYGSLQAELLASFRRHQRIPYPVAGIADLLDQTEVGRPVLVLQRVRNWLVPAWHYAVVIGFDREQQQLILRSGKQRRLQLSLADFLKSWRQGEQWGVVALVPGELPAKPDPHRYAAALADVEKLLPTDAALAAYQAASEQWPEHAPSFFGLANHQYAAGKLSAAMDSWRTTLRLQPGHAGASNNLAELLASQGRYTQALMWLDKALDRQVQPESLRPVLVATRTQIQLAMKKDRVHQ